MLTCKGHPLLHLHANLRPKLYTRILGATFELVKQSVCKSYCANLANLVTGVADTQIHFALLIRLAEYETSAKEPDAGLHVILKIVSCLTTLQWIVSNDAPGQPLCCST